MNGTGEKMNLRPQSPMKSVTRLGVVKPPEPSFPKEERFTWQKPQYNCDASYDLPDAKMTRSITFAGALRADPIDDRPDNKKVTTGPGSYDVSNSFAFNSEYVTKSAGRFASAPRQSMAMKTPSPGAVYHIENTYWNGPVKTIGIGFNRDHRKPLNGSTDGANAEMLNPQLPRSRQTITMAGRFKEKSLFSQGPGAIYDVHVSTTITSTACTHSRCIYRLFILIQILRL
jgi:hypothetical protein